MPQSSRIKKTLSYKDIVNALPDMMIRIGRDNTFKSFEGNVFGLFRPVEDCLGRSLDAVMPEAVAERFIRALDKTFSTGKMQQLEYQLAIADRVCHFEVRLTRCCEEEVVALVRDVTREREDDTTSLKQKEKEVQDRETLYSAILEGYEGFIYTIDENFRIRFLNEKLIRDLGHDANGRICYQALHNRQSKCRWCVADEVFAGRTVRFQMKNPRNKKWYYSVNVPVTLSDNARFCQAMIMDIDESKRMEETLRNSEAHLLEENSRLRSRVEDRHGFGDIVGQSSLMQEVYELLLLAASSENSVIIYGESGTGKELAARTIHDMSGRRNGRLVPINCGAIPQNLLESEFFGYKKGAFTGANTDRTGLLDEADKGSLFLDEIGEIETGFQVKLLRAIEGGGFTPVGGSGLHQPDFRIIAATNRNLTEKVKAGEMRSDFFYRIHVIPIYLPPLRKRKDDIPLLMEHFLKAYDRKIRPRITSKTMETLMAYSWPGNVRELQNVLYRFVTLKRLDLTGAAPDVEGGGTDAAPGSPAVEETASLTDAVAKFEKQFISSALARYRWNRTYTAKHLGVGLRTLQRKIKQFGIQ